MKYLFLDTSSFNVNIAIIIDNEIIENFSITNSPKLSENIFVYIEDIFKKSKIKINDIDKVFVVNGPGSFTGVRVGVTIAKTIAWSLKIPIITLSTLELYATTKVSEKYLIPFINDRNGYLYAGIYDNELNNHMIDKYLHMSELLKEIQNIKECVMIGYEKLDTTIEIVEPELDILKIINKYEDDYSDDVHLVKPNYLKMIDAERNLEKNNDQKNNN
ncbi:MAG: tRNA (adenosine(37)-N6)-threonylcarbamoyltransferase complex dimerization subunit type 1 TsaB [Bacilli bacterium]|nr:tRNA (adenosine(37)-N6)-threonylcarbamoyltransferase complex dimerization subunit type 1 TsaB [Bacilli bacterium]MDD4282190.1 tRNA (adenosine(37)-N6)-threonylcarbamoyltransferase complex dimerization subunit type 1 TsaB [Bacilli bacterium]MDD4718531.1 tRNA (adenosine(37)-N6)-threonylcarbamoyltransferase complex dimerization subunit type 1 TsaB [Bacilli bacterium]